MPTFEELQQTRQHLIDVYRRASLSWNRFKSSQQQVYLFETANILCDGLRQLNDDPFWTMLPDLLRGLEENWETVHHQLYDDYYALILLEGQVLQAFNVENTVVKNLAIDIHHAMDTIQDGIRGRPDRNAIENLPNSSRVLQDAVCRDFSTLQTLPTEPSPGSQEHRDYHHVVRYVGKGLFFVAGAVVVVANATAAPITWASIAAGFILMSNQVRFA